MENHQKRHITKNLDKLISCTTCGTMFLAKLIANDVIAEEDFQNLKSFQVPFERASQMYWIIQKRKNSYNHLIKALEDTKQTEAVAILRTLDKTSEEKTGHKIALAQPGDNSIEQPCELAKKSIFVGVRPPVRLFTGRLEEINEVHNKIINSQDKNVTVISQTASITGLGGIGKTEMCRMYIERYSDYYNRNIIWIEAEKVETISETFIKLARKDLGISTKDFRGDDRNIQDIVDDVYRFFKGQACLFVFDNAESSEQLETFLPLRVPQKPFVLITSRDRDWEFSVSILLLNELKEKEAIQFVKSGLNIADNSQDEAVTQLVTILQKFPLALQQAVSFIKQRRQIIFYDVDKYLKSYQVNANKLLNAKIPPAEFNDYKKTTFTTWKMTTILISLENDSGKMAIKILNLLSYFEADNIPVDILSSLFPNRDEESAFSAIQLLLKHSMVNSQPDQRTLSIHRLVQEVTKMELQRVKIEEEVLEDALSLFLHGLDETSVNHAVCVFRHACEFTSLILKYAWLAKFIVGELKHRERYFDAKKFGDYVLNIFKHHLPTDDLETLRLEFRIAIIDKRLKNHSLCLGIFQEILQKFKQLYPEQHAEILDLEFNIGLSMENLGNRNAALRIFEEVNNKQIKLFGKSKWYIANAIATIYCDMDNFEASIGWFQETLRLLELEKHDPNYKRNIVLVTQNLSVICKETNGLHEAISILQSLYDEMGDEYLNDIEYTTVGVNLANNLRLVGNYSEAYTLANDIHQRRKKLLGHDNLATLSALRLLGLLKAHEGDYDQALVMFKQVFNEALKQLGDDHNTVLDAKLQIATVLNKIGMREEALESAKYVLEKQIIIFGPNDFEVQKTQVEIANILEGMGMLKDSLFILKEVKRDVKKVYSPNHFRVATIRDKILRIKEKLGCD